MYTGLGQRPMTYVRIYKLYINTRSSVAAKVSTPNCPGINFTQPCLQKPLFGRIWQLCRLERTHTPRRKPNNNTKQSPKKLYKAQPDYTIHKINQELSDRLVNFQSGDTSNLTIW